MDWGATVGTAPSAGSLSFLRIVTLEIGVFFTPPHVLRKETAFLTLFTIPKVMEALAEGAGSTYSPTHSLQHCINWCSGCALHISSRIDPNTVTQDWPLDQNLEQDQHFPFKPATGCPVPGLHRSVPFLSRRRRAPSTLSVGCHSTEGFCVLTVVKSNKIVLTAHNGLFRENPTH